jgi:hypothetical protein
MFEQDLPQQTQQDMQHRCEQLAQQEQEEQKQQDERSTETHLHPPQQHTGGAKQQPSRSATRGLESDLIPHRLTGLFQSLSSHSVSDTDCTDATGLRADDIGHSTLAPRDEIVDDDLRQLRRLPTARLSGDDYTLVVPHQP